MPANTARDGSNYVLWCAPPGWLGLVSGRAGLVEIIFHPDPREVHCRVQQSHPAVSSRSDATLELAAAQLDAYFRGASRSFSLPLDFRNLSPFTVRVLKALGKVPYGQTLSYGELARLAGSPRAARAVGGVMARNPYPIVIPCHRVIGAAGRMIGYSGGAGIATKEWLLRFERQVEKNQGPEPGKK